jgi:hypothetical protein
MRLLITGGRKFADLGLMWSVLDRLHQEHHFTLLIPQAGYTETLLQFIQGEWDDKNVPR